MHATLPQSCLTLCDSLDRSLPGFSVHGITLGKNTAVGCHFLLQSYLPDLGTEPKSPALAGGFFTIEPPGKSKYHLSVQFSHSVVSDSLQPHESQHARPPCPSPTPGVHSDLRPSSQRCHLILCHPLLPLPPIPLSIRVFSNEST